MQDGFFIFSIVMILHHFPTFFTVNVYSTFIAAKILPHKTNKELAKVYEK